MAESNFNENTHENPNETEGEEDQEIVTQLQEIIKFVEADGVVETLPDVKTMKALIPKDHIYWLNSVYKEFNRKLKLLKKWHQNIKDEMIILKAICEEVIPTFEDARRQECISQMTQMEAQSEWLGEAIIDTRKSHTLFVISMIKDLLEIGKQAKKPDELLKE